MNYTCQECGSEANKRASRCMGCYWAMRPVVNWAYREVRLAIKEGKLQDLKTEQVACVDCGGLAHVWEHRDYLKPVDVEPVCRACNLKRGPAVPCLARLTSRRLMRMASKSRARFEAVQSRFWGIAA